ncbi:hypothetical protein HY489_02260 [Candidatus Woesearchaeota archaeon]|nr:hypothetical protein [Candidatus Woesearchaeota archaeon]
MPKADIGSGKKASVKDFEKLQLRIGTIASVKKHPKKDSLYVLIVDTAAADEDIQVVASLADYYKIDELLGKQVVVVCNLPPENVHGEESQGMLLVSQAGKKTVLIGPHAKCPEGAKVSGIMNGTFHHHERN